MMSSSSRSPGGSLPDCTWGDEYFTLPDYLDRFKGPEVVLLTTPDGKPPDLGPLVDTSRPCMVYSHRRRTKVYAEAVVKDSNNKFIRKGPLYEIPKDYVGWFEVLSKAGRVPGHYGTIGSLASSNCKYFLTRTALRGFKVTKDDDEGQGQVKLGKEVALYPGEVLRTHKLVKRQWKVNKDKDINGKPPPQTQFLKCSDLKKNYVCLPLAHPGKFSVIADRVARDTNVVYQVWNVLDNHPLPVLVKLAFGWAPTDNNLDFKGTFRLLQSSRPDSLIIYSFTGEGCVLFELPLDANIKIQVATNQKDLIKSTAFKNALQQCQRRVFPYAISLKALTMEYERAPSSSSDDVETKKPSIAEGMMAQPRDMNQFNRSDVYPPLDDDHVSDTWSFSFKDPDYMSEAELLEMEKQGESEDNMGTAQLWAAQAREARHDKGISTAGYEPPPSVTMAEVHHRKGVDARGEKMKQIKEREAPC